MVRTIPLHMKGRVLQFWRDHGRNMLLAARTFNIDRRTVRDIVFPPPPRVSKPRRVRRSVADRRRAVKICAVATHLVGNVEYPLYCSVREILAELSKQRRWKDTTPYQVRHDLRLLGFRNLVRKKVPTRNPAVLAKRLAFCKQVISDGTSAARKIIFSDEHYVTTNDNSRRTMWVAPNETVIPRELKRVPGASSLMMWGAIGVGYKSPLIVFPPRHADGEAFRMNGAHYVRRCLSRVANDLAGRVFMQDGARPHTCKSTMAYLTRKRIRVLEHWPPYSPDLNPIELLWSILNDRIARHHPRSLTELTTALQTEWAAITQAEIDKLCDGFFARVVEVRNANGACL